jgi:proton-dependent oligopeptide transporter, POT family
MTTGFILAASSFIFGAVPHYRVYKISPCGYHTTGCIEGVSPISIWWQVSIVVLGGASESLCWVTACKMAYTNAPKDLKAIVLALFFSMTAVPEAFLLPLLPAIPDPHLIWVWAGPGIALFAQTALFWCSIEGQSRKRHSWEPQSKEGDLCREKIQN